MIHPDPIIRRIHACALAAVPPFLWGDPGTGKTARVFAYGRMRSLHVERWLLSRCEPIDLKPRIYHEGRMIVADPPEVERVRSQGGILFFDELNLASRETEGAALNLQDNPPPGVFVMAAGNPPSRGQAARHLGSPAANRFCHLQVEGDPKAWASAQVAGWTIEPLTTLAIEASDGLKRAQQEVTTLVAAFIRHQPQKLQSKPETPAEAGGAWASPRTWEYCARLLAVAKALDLPEEDALALAAGCIGAGLGSEIAAFADAKDLPDPEALLADPSAYAPPARIDRIIATCAGVASCVERDLTDARWKAAWALCTTIADAGAVDAAMVFCDMLFTDLYTKLPKATLDDKRITAPRTLMPKKIVPLLTGVK